LPSEEETAEKLKQTYCVAIAGEEDRWCAVLGNHYPNFQQKITEEFDGLVEGGLTGIFAGKGVWCTQRLCDQQNVQYKFVVLRAPTCPECLRIKQLMVEYADLGTREQEDDADERDGSAESGDGGLGGRADAGEADAAGGAGGQDVERGEQPGEAVVVGAGEELLREPAE
jgi:hypothetical protein